MFCQWSGILLSWTSELAGTKEKIEKSFVVKAHFEVSCEQQIKKHVSHLCLQKAIAIDDSEADVKHLLGRWHVFSCCCTFHYDNVLSLPFLGATKCLQYRG